MAKGLLRNARYLGRSDQSSGRSDPCSLDIQLDEKRGLLRIYDPRAFHLGRRGFCRRLIEAASERPDFERAEIDLGTASCRLHFDPRSATARSMADAVTDAIRAAAIGPDSDRIGWWRRPTRWSNLTAYRTSHGIAWWETRDGRSGRLLLSRESPTADLAGLARVSEALSTLEGIEGIRISSRSRTLTIDYRPDGPADRHFPDAVERALQANGHEGPSGLMIVPDDREPHPGGGTAVVANGYRRLGYLALAGGSFALTVVGLIVPGVPTVPFLLATSYYLARSSPRMDERLRRAPVFGRVLNDWEQYHGLSRSSKARLIGLVAGIVAVTVAISAGAPAVLVVILVIALSSVYGIVRIAGVPGERPIGLDPKERSRLALLSP